MKKELTRAQEYFNNTPEAKKVYETSDGFVFEQIQNAVSHASTLEDKQVLTLGRDGELFTDENPLDALTDAQKEILENGLESRNYTFIKEIVKVLNIETVDQKADTLINALKDFKSKI